MPNTRLKGALPSPDASSRVGFLSAHPCRFLTVRFTPFGPFWCYNIGRYALIPRPSATGRRLGLGGRESGEGKWKQLHSIKTLGSLRMDRLSNTRLKLSVWPVTTPAGRAGVLAVPLT